MVTDLGGLIKKYIVFLLVSVLATFASAQTVLKDCSFIIKATEDQAAVATTFKVVKNGEMMFAQMIQNSVQALSDEVADRVSISQELVRSNLTSKSEKMNPAEKLIADTMETIGSATDPKIYDINIDLKAIRRAKVYQIGVEDELGSLAIVEAQDEAGRPMGSFLASFVPFMCNVQ
ncbi:MAG: hypothetical protein H7061_02050 [Bdellovibrionaceae bacterium]|nr:hypothetical protein [Bdellovibrio sp.]